MDRRLVVESLLLRPGLEPALARFLGDLARAGDGGFFHPHPVDPGALRAIAERPGKDLYYVFVQGGVVQAYGLLRGWNEGFAIPSLGIAVHPDARDRGLGSLVMDYLEGVARCSGAPAIRLRVHKDNARAVGLYERRGYAMQADAGDARLLVGTKPLRAAP